MYSEFVAEPDLQRAIIFHGHFCPGLAIGYRASILALERLAPLRTRGDALLAIVENKSCAVDAVQCLTGCTFGKDNFIYHDYGKHAYTLALRPSGRAVRVALRSSARLPEDLPDPDQWVNWLLAAPAAEVFDIHMVNVELPSIDEKRQLVTCDSCGELVQADYYFVEADGSRRCQACQRSLVENGTDDERKTGEGSQTAGQIG